MRSFVVLGMGSFGCSVATTLTELGNEVLAIDSDEETINKISNRVTSAVIGDVTDEDTLKSLGVDNFDTAIVSIGEDIQSSILVTLILKDIGVNMVVAKARDKMHAKILEKVGADRVVFVEGEMGIKIARSLVSKNFFDFIELSNDHSIIEVRSPIKWKNKTIKELNIRAKFGLNIIAIKRPDSIIVSPVATDIIDEKDILIMLGSNKDINKFNKSILEE